MGINTLSFPVSNDNIPKEILAGIFLRDTNRAWCSHSTVWVVWVSFFFLCGFFDGFGVGLFLAAAVLLAGALCAGTAALLLSAAPGLSAALEVPQVGSAHEFPQF